MSKLTFQKFDSSDFDLYYLLVSNQQVMNMITERAIPLIEAKDNFNKLLDRNQKCEVFGSYKVYHDKKEFIGLGSFILNEEKKDEAEIGYMLLPKFWGKGFGGQIADNIIDKAKSTNINRLTAIIDPKNTPSKTILIKRGFLTEKVCEIGGLPGEVLSKAL